MKLLLNINAGSGIPIYIQIIEGIRQKIELGQLRAADSLPSVRSLAQDLRIAPATLVRAYAELQREGLIESRAGSGTTVTARAVRVRENGLDARLKELTTIMTFARNAGVSRAELEGILANQLNSIYDKEEP